MLYTLLKFLGWGALLALIGGCIGWALRALKCRGEVARARAATVDHDEVERMRHRLANLETVVAERDRLRIQLADLRHADSPGVVGAVVDDSETKPIERLDPADAESIADAVAQGADDVPHDTADDATDNDVTVDDVTADAAPSIIPAGASGDGDGESESDEAQGSTSVAGVAAVPDLTDDHLHEDEPADASAAETEPETEAEPGAESGDTAAAGTEEAPVLDAAAAAAVLGKKIKLDDLTVVEGIGPKISQLCSGIGITTWRQLADTDVAELQSMLDAAGSRYSVHKPGTWSQQAGLLAAGEWEAFKALTDELDGGR